MRVLRYLEDELNAFEPHGRYPPSGAGGLILGGVEGGNWELGGGQLPPQGTHLPPGSTPHPKYSFSLSLFSLFPPLPKDINPWS